MATHLLDTQPDPEHVAEVLGTGYTIRYNDETGTAEIESVLHASDDELAKQIGKVRWRKRPVDDEPGADVDERPVAQRRAEVLERAQLAQADIAWHEARVAEAEKSVLRAEASKQDPQTRLAEAFQIFKDSGGVIDAETERLVENSKRALVIVEAMHERSQEILTGFRTELAAAQQRARQHADEARALGAAA